MKDKKMGVCLICGTEFVKTRPDKKYCSRRCTQIAMDRAQRARKKEAMLKQGKDCPHNKVLVCTDRKCDTCGWNPVVAKRRSESHGKR